MSQSSSRKTITCLVVGDGNVGKSTFIKCLHANRDNSTLTCENGSHRLSFGTVHFKPDDFTRQRSLIHVDFNLVEADEASLQSAPKPDCAIILIDVTRGDAVISCHNWANKLREECGITRPFVAGNKHDLVEFSECMQALYLSPFASSCSEISSLTGQNIFAPMNYLLDRSK